MTPAEFLNKSTGVSLALMLKVCGAIVAVMLVYSTLALRVSVVETNQARRMDANIIANVELLKEKNSNNETRFKKIEVETDDWKENKKTFVQMAEDIETIKSVLIK